MDKGTIQILIICITMVLIILGISFFIWDYFKNKTTEDRLYDSCINKCSTISIKPSSDSESTKLKEVNCKTDCLSIFNCKLDSYNQKEVK